MSNVDDIIELLTDNLDKMQQISLLQTNKHNTYPEYVVSIGNLHILIDTYYNGVEGMIGLLGLYVFTKNKLHSGDNIRNLESVYISRDEIGLWFRYKIIRATRRFRKKLQNAKKFRENSRKEGLLHRMLERM